MTKTNLYNYLAVVFCSLLLITNILSFKVVTILGLTLPAAVIVFPIVYIINDVLAEVYGFKKARNVIMLGFVINLFAVIVYQIAIALPSPEYFEGAEAFKTVLGSTTKVLVGSFVAYLIGSLFNSYIMVKMKDKLEKYLMLRCVVSTMVGETLDAMIFITIAFIGTMSFEALLVMIVSQAMFKTIYEIIVYPVTKITINKVKVLA